MTIIDQYAPIPTQQLHTNPNSCKQAPIITNGRSTKNEAKKQDDCLLDYEHLAGNLTMSDAITEHNNDISNGCSKRRLFTDYEDCLLAQAAKAFHEVSWNQIAQCVPGRSPRQCRDRWMNYLKPSLKFEPWTNEEDELLVKLVNTYGTHWTKMSSSFPSRSKNSIKNRWYWLIKYRVIALPGNPDEIRNSNEILNAEFDPGKSDIGKIKNEIQNISTAKTEGIYGNPDEIQIGSIAKNADHEKKLYMLLREPDLIQFKRRMRKKSPKINIPLVSELKADSTNFLETVATQTVASTNQLLIDPTFEIVFNAEELNW